MNHASIPVWKPQGWTPLQAVLAYKKLHPHHDKETISYAGRLDPMAEGVLLLLVGDENKKRTQYEHLPKTYESDMVLGITTDSLDALGIITHHNFQTLPKEKITSVLSQFLGPQDQHYPIYSSRAVNGKPLYWWARNNKLSEITIPSKKIDISSLQLIHMSDISIASLYTEVVEKIRPVTGDFRQKEILTSWETFVKTHKNQTLQRVNIRVSCSTGTYIRKLVSDMGDTLGCGGFALSIIRTSVDHYTKKDCVLLV